MSSRPTWLLITILLACTATDVRPDLKPEHVVPVPAPKVSLPIEREHACEQHYPAATAAPWDEPWIWGDTRAEPCQWGCTTVRGEVTRYDRTSVTLDEDGALRVTGEDGRNGAWSRHVPAGSLVAPEAIWLGGWCPRQLGEDERIFVAMADARILRVLSIERDSGALVADREISLATRASPEGPTEVRLYCDSSGGPQVHAKQGDTAWTVRLGRDLDVLSLQALPANLTSWEWKLHVDRRGTERGYFVVTERTKPSSHDPYAAERDEITTSDRRYVVRRRAAMLVGLDTREEPTTNDRHDLHSAYELRAFDLAGNLLWQRPIDKPTPGCIEGLGILGCSRCPGEEAGLGTRDGFVVLWTTGLAFTIDVFDADGRHVAYLHY